MTDTQNTSRENRRVLLIDDDVELCTMLAEYLSLEGFEVTQVHDGAQGLERARQGGVDLIVLDVMLPGMNGLEVLKALREDFETPVLMLTARGEDVDRIVGLEVGADDYLAKPFNTRELIARIRAVLRRTPRSGGSTAAPDTVQAGPLVLEPASLAARLHDKPLTLTGAEFRVLENLAVNAGKIVSRDTLTESALGRRLEPFDRAIDTHVSNLRKKLGPLPDGGTPIRNVRGAGYLLSFASSSDSDA
ncbi:MAG: response regulator transcription factor [Pseudomonadota bacterium]